MRKPSTPTPAQATPPSRRGFLLGAAAASAAVTAVATLPQAQQAIPDAVAPEAPPAPERGGGYHVSDHVKQYYKTTRF